AADIFKVAHHGSLSASSPDFLAAVKPRVAIISVGADNKFGHPAPITLDKLRVLSLDTYRTDYLGTISFLANYK
ncbi:MAG: hypothetical protein WCR20_23725, partial [Verrucomicrobiota bacterium]